MKEASLVEFKVNRFGISWGETWVDSIGWFPSFKKAQKAAERIADKEQKEVRFNVRGESEGHVVQPRPPIKADPETVEGVK